MEENIVEANPKPSSNSHRTLLYVLLALFLVFLGAFGLWVYQKSSTPKELPTSTFPPQITKPVITSAPDITKPVINSNSFLFNQNNEILYLGLAQNDSLKPVLQKIADKVINYSLSPDKSKIAYVSNGNLIIKDLKSNAEKVLQKVAPENYIKEIPDPDYIQAIGGIVWTADGTKIAFVGGADKQGDIYTINIDGTDLKRLTNDKLNEFSLAWSPDNKKIAFQKAEGFGTGAGFTSSILVVDSDGSNLKQLALNGKLPGDHKFSPAENFHWISSNEFMFTSWTMGGRDGVWKADVLNNLISPITENRGGAEPKWSETNQSYIYPLTGKDFLIIGLGKNPITVSTSVPVNKIIWSKDGKKILYTVDNNSSGETAYDLFIANSDGSGQKKINPTPTFISDFSLSSDGKIVLYTKRLFNPDMHTEVWKINIDGSNDTQIDTAPDIYGVLTAPSGNYAVYSVRKNEKYIGYWVNLDNLSKETVSEESSFIFWPEFL